MRFGLHYLLSCAAHQRPAQRYRDTIEQAVRSEALGFESVWPVEHHFDPRLSISPCPTLLLAAIASRTERLRLGTAIVQLALANPLAVAEQVATLDALSGGRVELGVGRGSNPLHYAGFGVPVEEGRERLAEGIEFLERAFNQEVFSFRGRFYHADNVRLAPAPATPPRMHLAANSADTAEMAGKLGLPIVVAAHVHPAARLRELVASYRRARREHGHSDMADRDVSVVLPLYVADSREQVEREVAPSVTHALRTLAAASDGLLARCRSEPERAQLIALLSVLRANTFENMQREQAIFATPSECVERLLALRELTGAGRVITWFNFGGLVPHDQVLASMALFAERVMPRLPQ